ncbi:MAG: alpha/beta hydrolase [Bordetella sp. SCN 67-23]|nr:alpha/beta fold hydrolase [Burkholderiales bacterium]ODS74153.1 MAG: alpha/beta hydrolase [Bordetella sp. SCN 67-23]ODU76900.1 MAG: alpha/beta hydrolase [Bordetella sp. SCN 68-11]OJW87401.1 MAG: alpha/beta hydrolase [Burkholderiales bacterium 67-32]
MIKSADFYFEGGRAGVLLIHGLTGTPNEMRTVGKGLHRAGFTVYGMQLAGHCGDLDDLVRTGWKDWYASVLEGVDRLRRDVDHCFVAGLSMGAVLALKAAADRPDDIAGVGVYGATFRYDGWNIPWYWRLSFLLPWFKRFNLFQDKTFDEEPPYGLKDERLRAAVSSSMLGGDSADAGLPGNPWSSLTELIDLSATVRRQLRQVRAPCLVMHAAEDDMASVGNAHLVMERVSGPSKLVLLHDSYHMITVDRERREVIRESAEFFSEIAAQREGAAPQAAR